ncbi:hypothetical protein D3C83_267690 [compost metagenome]
MDSPAGFTWPAFKPDQRIDLIWLSKNDWNVKPGTTRVLGGTDLSDHHGVIVDVARAR